jgi:hypothetical protein
MRFRETSIDIDATADQVWAILTDIEVYERDAWNAYIESITGVISRGERVTAVLKAPEQPRRTVRPTLVSATFPELSWEVKLVGRPVLHALHYFKVEPTGSHSCRFIQGEQVRGALTFMVFHLVDKSVSGFHTFNEAIKRRAEAASTYIKGTD